MTEIDTEGKRLARMVEIDAEKRAEERDREAADESSRRENRDFVQVYPKGWARLQALILDQPNAARVYAFLAAHMDDQCGAICVSQDVIAEELKIHKRTVIRLTKDLEEKGAIIRIRVGTGVYAYALDPTEVWRSWDDKKNHAAFVTKTLVKKSDRANNQVRRKLKVMLGDPDPS